ncbi:MAG: hypothetical protein ACRECV_16695 [Xanthobacteraceae bacterium]
MQKRKLGASGPEVSPVGLGANNFGGRIEASRRVFAATGWALSADDLSALDRITL